MNTYVFKSIERFLTWINNSRDILKDAFGLSLKMLSYFILKIFKEIEIVSHLTNIQCGGSLFGPWDFDFKKIVCKDKYVKESQISVARYVYTVLNFLGQRA